MNILPQNQYQILFPAVVLDVEDPAMLGRIRAVFPNTDVISMLSGIDPKKISGGDLLDEFKWTSIDPLVFLPLLPFFISQVPRKGEYIHTLYMNKLYPNKNQFYIQGPFSSPMMSDFEAYNSAEKFLAAGDLIKAMPNIRNQNGTFKSDWSEGVFPMPGDNAILGRKFSDIIFKSRYGDTGLEDSVLIRAGKTKYLDASAPPIANDNRSFLQLSYFSCKEIDNGTLTEGKIIEVVRDVKKMVIWHIENLESNYKFTGWVGLYNVIKSDKTNTKNFQSDTILNLSIGVDYSGPLEEIKFSAYSFEEASNLINKFIEGIFKGDLSNIPSYAVNSKLNFAPELTFPFVVTPSSQTYKTGVNFDSKKTTTDIVEQSNYIKFYTKIKLNQGLVNSGWFLVWENKNDVAVIGPQAEVKLEKIDKVDFVNDDISYSTLGGQKVYLLSQDSSGPKGKINLYKTLYGIPQNKFVGGKDSIYNKTYPMVRGDEIISLLRKMFSFITGHVHPTSTLPPVAVAAGNGQTSTEIDTILANAETTILNQQIRIN